MYRTLVYRIERVFPSHLLEVVITLNGLVNKPSSQKAGVLLIAVRVSIRIAHRV